MAGVFFKGWDFAADLDSSIGKKRAYRLLINRNVGYDPGLFLFAKNDLVNLLNGSKWLPKTDGSMLIRAGMRYRPYKHVHGRLGWSD